MSEEQDLLIESTVPAHRERDGRGRLVAPSAWHDLSVDARETAYELQARTRDLERAVDRFGYSGTVRAVMAHLFGE